MTYLQKRKELNDTTPTHLSAVSGMGSEIWKSKDDIDKYIDEERQW